MVIYTQLLLSKLQSHGAVDISSLEHVNHLSSAKKRHELLAAEFRKRMSDGQTYESPSEYRRKFFDEVIKSAEEVSYSRSQFYQN